MGRLLRDAALTAALGRNLVAREREAKVQGKHRFGRFPT